MQHVADWRLANQNSSDTTTTTTAHCSICLANSIVCYIKTFVFLRHILAIFFGTAMQLHQLYTVDTVLLIQILTRFKSDILYITVAFGNSKTNLLEGYLL